MLSAAVVSVTTPSSAHSASCVDRCSGITNRLVAAWPGKSSGNSWLSSPPGTYHLMCPARCMQPVFARLYHMVAKRGDPECLWPKAAPLQWPRHDPLDLWHQWLDTFSFTTSMSCIKSVTDLVIPGSIRQERPRNTWSECVKNDARECGQSGIGLYMRDAWRDRVWHSLVLPTPSNGIRTAA